MQCAVKVLQWNCCSRIVAVLFFRYIKELTIGRLYVDKWRWQKTTNNKSLEILTGSNRQLVLAIINDQHIKESLFFSKILTFQGNTAEEPTVCSLEKIQLFCGWRRFCTRAPVALFSTTWTFRATGCKQWSSHIAQLLSFSCVPKSIVEGQIYIGDLLRFSEGRLYPDRHVPLAQWNQLKVETVLA